ncbi:MAG: group III truncated hemoglobin [Cytophagaceae bacterium]
MNMALKDITTEDDIKVLVDTFYNHVNNDELLGPIFNIKSQVDWSEHLPKMYKFWGTQLIGTSNYQGRPFPPHMILDLEKHHFDRWIGLFFDTVDECFMGPIADIAKQKAFNIAMIFQYKLGIIKNEE